MFSSLHTHTTFCDGRADIETMCKAAFDNKLKAIGFSAHAPVDKQLGYKTGWHLLQENLDEYVSKVNEAKLRWENKIDVYLGLEVDYIKEIRSPMDKDIQDINADYLIGSVHYVIPPQGEIFTVDGSAEEFDNGLKNGFLGDAEALMNAYYDAQKEMISLGGFEILGHADLLKKNCEDKNFWDKQEEELRQKEIAKESFNAKIIVEVNTGGINRKKVKDTYPGQLFLRFLNDFNVPVIITADAHNEGHICGNYDAAVLALKRAGFTHHFLPNGIKNGKIDMLPNVLPCSINANAAAMV